MKFELDADDLSVIARMQEIIASDDTTNVSDRFFHKTVKLINKINSQIPDPTVPGATRRIRVYSDSK